MSTPKTVDPGALLDQIEARANAATAGPWEDVMDIHGGPRSPEYAVWAGSDNSGEYVAEHIGLDPDAEFIAHARADVPALVAALRAVLELTTDYERAPWRRTNGVTYEVLAVSRTHLIEAITTHLGGAA